MRVKSGRPRRWSAGLLVALAALAALVWVSGRLAERHAQRALVHVLERRMEHPLHIAGGLETHFFSLRPRIIARDVEIGNPSWSDRGTLGHVGRAEILLEWHLAWPPFAIRRLVLERSDWDLRRDAHNHANWTASADGAGEGPPYIGSLSMPMARVHIDDDRAHLKFAGIVAAGTDGAGASPPLVIDANGELNGRPTVLHIDGDPLVGVRSERAWHFSLQEHSGDTRLLAQGYFLHPFDFREIEASFQATGPTLHDAYQLVGLSLPETQPFSASGHLSRRDLRFEYRDLRVTAGDSDLEGTLTVESGNGPPHTTGELSSGRMRLADLVGPEGKSVAGSSESSLSLGALRGIEAGIRYRAQQLDVGRQRLRGVDSEIDIHAGALRVLIPHSDFAGGEVSGSLQLDANGATPVGDVDLHFQQLRLDELGGSEHRAATSGVLDGRLRLSSQGDTWRALMDASRGDATFVIPRGTIRASLAHLADADIGGILNPLGSHKDVPIHCGVASFDAAGGVFRSRMLVLDTEAAVFSGNATVDLGARTLEAHIRGRPRHPTLSLRSGIVISGPLERPRFKAEKAGALLQGGAAFALGAVLTPLAAAFAFVDPGLTHDSDCAALLAEASDDAHSPN